MWWEVFDDGSWVGIQVGCYMVVCFLVEGGGGGGVCLGVGVVVGGVRVGGCGCVCVCVGGG